MFGLDITEKREDRAATLQANHRMAVKIDFVSFLSSASSPGWTEDFSFPSGMLRENNQRTECKEGRKEEGVGLALSSR